MASSAQHRLTGERVVLRPLTEADREPLRAILEQPSVRRWWGVEPVEATVHDLLDDDDVAAYAITFEGRLVGSIQFTEEGDAAYRHAAVDIFMDTDHQGRGLGPDAIRTLARHLFEDRGHHRLSIDPAAANEHAIQAYERVGFRRVGILRSYERGSDGTFHDGLLMDLLAGELMPAS